MHEILGLVGTPTPLWNNLKLSSFLAVFATSFSCSYTPHCRSISMFLLLYSTIQVSSSSVDLLMRGKSIVGHLYSSNIFFSLLTNVSAATLASSSVVAKSIAFWEKQICTASPIKLSITLPSLTGYFPIYVQRKKKMCSAMLTKNEVENTKWKESKKQLSFSYMGKIFISRWLILQSQHFIGDCFDNLVQVSERHVIVSKLV